MKNILFIHSSADLYGSDRTLLNIVKYIDKNKYNLFILLPTSGPLVNELNKLANIKIIIFDFAVLRRKDLNIVGVIKFLNRLKKSYKFLGKFVEKEKIDIVYTNTSVIFCGAIIAKRKHIKSIWHVREIIKNKYENMFISFLLNKCSDVVVVNSKATGDSLKVPTKKIRVVYNSVESINSYFPLKHSGKEIVVGMAGRINRWKGQKLFVDVAYIIHKKYPNVIFKIAGDTCLGEEFLRKDLENYIKNKNLSNVVSLIGYVKDMNEFYSSLDIFVLPSIQPEPFGLVITEAMEYGIPVVATNHGGPVEIIEHNKSGYLVDYKEPYDMANAIIKLILNKKKRQEMGDNGRIRKKDLFSMDSMINSIENILDEV